MEVGLGQCCAVAWYILSVRGGRWGGDELRKFWGGFLVGGKVVELRDQSFWVLAGRWLVGSVRSVAVGGRRRVGRARAMAPPPLALPEWVKTRNGPTLQDLESFARAGGYSWHRALDREGPTSTLGTAIAAGCRACAQVPPFV